ncbi:MAG: hypothetical protein PHH47_05650 [Gallionella sp.]|nr:hypothetical protein [Gallionella sp.]MDD4945567.1 hypothetical protein [Gallionella sp.]MDD5612983.1 hypothetical protein [Gallionella sp.]
MLRTRLQEITDSNDVASHQAQIEAARTVIPHTIEALTNANDNRLYNCVMFALGIATDPNYFAMACRCPDDVHASTQFIHFLAERGYLVESESQSPGVLIAYLDGDQFRHIGIVTEGGRVRSKWGIGHLYEHAPFEAPASYGSTFRFFNPMDREAVLDAFFEFGELRGCRFEDSDG